MNPFEEIRKQRSEIYRAFMRGEITEKQMEREQRELDREERLHDGMWDSDDY